MLLNSQIKHHSAEGDILSIFWAIPSRLTLNPRGSGRAIHCNSSPPRRVPGFRFYPYCGWDFKMKKFKIYFRPYKTGFG